MTQLPKMTMIFTDGACSGNPGPGGFGAVVLTTQGQVWELGGGERKTTNNRMEMTAIVCALDSLREESGPLWILTDSTYVIRGVTQWIHSWKRNHWQNSQGEEVSNLDLWKELDRKVSGYKKRGLIDWKYVRGHQGVPGNERCDQIAVAFSKNEVISLYKGSVNEYPYDLLDLPKDMGLPKNSSSTKKNKKAYSYLSLVNGKLCRHSSWSECEAEVKGRPGAKFKKAFSLDEEKEIVSSWGRKFEDIE